MFVTPGFEGLKIVSAREDGGREGVPVYFITPRSINIHLIIYLFGENNSYSLKKK